MVYLTQDICNAYKDSGQRIDLSKEAGQCARLFKSISNSYNKIADGLIKLL